jgi:hypothetical protein
MNGRKITRGGVKSGVAALALASFALLLAPADASGQIWRGDRAGWRGERAESRRATTTACAKARINCARENATTLTAKENTKKARTATNCASATKRLTGESTDRLSCAATTKRISATRGALARFVASGKRRV